ncbi:MAG: hypothetical protein II844_03625 [Prevotella sp.]|jgi:hypothetical protein|nr:hypothetical protein [Prevotella sp.]
MTKKDIARINDTTIVRKTTVIGSFALGWLITIAGFIVPPLGVIDNSVIIILGQALTYTAVGVGLKEYGDIQNARINQLLKDSEKDKEEAQ